jgi:hypothetical protein
MMKSDNGRERNMYLWPRARPPDLAHPVRKQCRNLDALSYHECAKPPTSAFHSSRWVAGISTPSPLASGRSGLRWVAEQLLNRWSWARCGSVAIANASLSFFQHIEIWRCVGEIGGRGAANSGKGNRCACVVGNLVQNREDGIPVNSFQKK